MFESHSPGKGMKTCSLKCCKPLTDRKDTQFCILSSVCLILLSRPLRVLNVKRMVQQTFSDDVFTLYSQTDTTV